MKIISRVCNPKFQHCTFESGLRNHREGSETVGWNVAGSQTFTSFKSEHQNYDCSAPFCVQVLLPLCFPSSPSQASMTPAVRPCSLLLISLARRTPTCTSTPACSPHRAPSPTTLPRLPLRAQRVISRRPSSTAARWDPRGPRRATRSRRRVREEPCLTPQWDTSTRDTRSSCSPARRTCPSTRWRRWVGDALRVI